MSLGLDGTYHSRTRDEIEEDVLVALLTITHFRTRVLGMFGEIRWCSHDHRVLARALAAGAPDPTEVDAFVADALGWSHAVALDWRIAASPVDYDHDLFLLQQADLRG